MTREFKERLEEIRWTLAAPGAVFYGHVSESGHVSQRVVDAKPDMEFMLSAIDTLMNYSDELEYALIEGDER